MGAAVAPGARIVVRDAEWIVRRVDSTSTGGQAVQVVGCSALVKDRQAIFLTEVEERFGNGIQVMDPAATELVPDSSPHYRNTLLYIESLLRQTPPTDPPTEGRIYIGHKAAMDIVPYQLDPAIQALQQPRQRILIADAVGLGKTLECGILLSELIRRGRGKRILVVALKSMLTQFQKEMWSRFAIPLTRLDSVGIQRVRQRIPTNHNPFHYFDKAIVSIDTLKQDTEYRTYLEDCYWDAIVIDEAQNVAERGSSSQRSKLAKLLASRSDTLLMLSATPHDGRKQSFASLMNMLNPTAIANPEDYGPADIKGLFIRRFKKDIQFQVQTAFKDRVTHRARGHASPKEEAIFDYFTEIEFTRLDQRRHAGKLFKTTLEKALFSSPAACIDTARNRIRTLEGEEGADNSHDVGLLQGLIHKLAELKPGDFSKYQRLIQVIRDDWKWAGKDANDRLVIFTERIDTLLYLQAQLTKDLKLKPKQVEVLNGTLSDVDQQRIIEDFGKDDADIRLLIASDIASEGINLHYLSHRLVHFDMPWSLMVFQQRNGRVDRYGQEAVPQILYLLTDSTNAKIKGDLRILEILMAKDQQAYENIGDPSAFMKVYDIEQEEAITAKAIEEGKAAETFDRELDEDLEDDPLAILFGEEDIPVGEAATEATRDMLSIFPDDYLYAKEAIDFIQSRHPIQVRFDDDQKFINLTAPEDLQYRSRDLPREIVPDSWEFILTTDRDKIQDEIKRCRKEELAWPKFHLLWDLHPAMEWLNDKVLTAFGRHEAPVVTLDRGLVDGEVIFLASGLIPNRKSHPLIHRWFGIQFINGQFEDVDYLEDILDRFGLGKQSIPNPKRDVDLAPLRALLPQAIAQAKTWMSANRDEFNAILAPKLQEQLDDLQRLKAKRLEQLEFEYAKGGALSEKRLERKKRDHRQIDTLFEQYEKWIADTMTTEDNPYIRIAAVLTGART